MGSLKSLKMLFFKVYILLDKICYILIKIIAIAKQKVSFPPHSNH